MEVNEVSRERVTARASVPVCNQHKFDLETQSYFEEIKIAYPQRRQELIAEWRRRAVWLQKNQNAHKAPPLLCRLVGESDEDYLKRCYETGGYR